MLSLNILRNWLRLGLLLLLLALFLSRTYVSVPHLLLVF
jgi:hypothetical protein